MMPTRNQVRPSTAPSTLERSQYRFNEADDRSRRSRGTTNRYQAKRFNVLRGTSRSVAPESMRVNKVGLDGLYRYDVPPQTDRRQGTLRQVYMSEFKQRRNPHGGPIYTVNGLQNFSHLPTGDMRVNRTVSTLKETYINPAHRAFFPPRYDHIQDGEPTDNDGELGPVSSSSSASASVAASRMTANKKSFARPATAHPQSTTRQQPPPSAAGSEEEELELRARRQSYYRYAVEHVDPKQLDKQERVVRDKVKQRVKGSNYHLRATFRYFDRDAKGSIDLPAFRGALVLIGLELDEHTVIALFSRYDVQCNGFIGYHEYVEQLLGDDSLTKSETEQINRQVRASVNTIKESLEYKHKLGQSSAIARAYMSGSATSAAAGAAMTLQLRRSKDAVDVQALSDEEFLGRQRIRKLFTKLDKNSSGSISKEEFRVLLRRANCACTNREAGAVFEFIDIDGNRCIKFDEFYSWLVAPAISTQATRNLGYC